MLGTDECSLCQWITWASDPAGFVGALLLAWPFVRRQQARDDLLAAIIAEVDEDDFDEYREALRGAAGRILETADRDYRIGLIGTLLIAAAFFVKMLPSISAHLG